jgi:hypothetical protein
MLFWSLQSWPLRHTSDHKTPHVPHDEIALEPQDRSQVKVEPPKQVQNLSKVKAVSKLRLSAQDQINEVEFYNSHLLLVPFFKMQS